MIWLLKVYQHALKVHPIRTAAISAGTLLSVGDVLAQLVVEKVPLEKYNAKRTVRFGFFGTFFGGPLFSIWYTRLARKFGHAKYGPLKMVACDQLLFAPPFIAYFLIVMEILKGESLLDIKLKLQDDYLDVMKTNYKIWPAVQAINFTFVPVHYRYSWLLAFLTSIGSLFQIVAVCQISTFPVARDKVLVVNLVSVGWNTYLAWKVELVHPHPELLKKKVPENIAKVPTKQSIKVSEPSL